MRWFDQHRRDLPWRTNRTAYRVWLAEIMLQQTTVTTVIPKFAAFVERFPTIDALAQAPLDHVLAQWQGLGYYARARHLHQSAQHIAQHGWPRTRQAWQSLPGVGPYSAASIIAITQGVAAIALDGNLRRILSRVHHLDLRRAQLEQTLSAAEQHLVCPDRPGDWNEALMDLAATVCRPTNPECTSCPLARYCRARPHGAEILNALPRREPKKARPTIERTAVLIRNPQQQIAIAKRPATGLLANLFCVPILPELTAQPLSRKAVQDQSAAFLAALEAPVMACGAIQHQFTHFRLHLDVVQVIVGPEFRLPEPLFWATPASVRQRSEYPQPTLMVKLHDRISDVEPV